MPLNTSASMDGSLRILHITAPGEAGGLERVVETLAPGQVNAGHRVTVLAVVGRGEPRSNPLRKLREGTGVDLHVAPLPPRAYRKERRVTARLLASQEPHVVHTHGYRPDVVDSGVARSLGFPTVSTVHGFTGGGLKNRFYEGLQRKAHGRMDAVVAVSRPLARHLEREGLPRERIQVVGNAWSEDPDFLPRDEARRTLKCPDGDLHLGWVGRMSREKGPDLLVDALRHLDGVPVRVSMVGVGAVLPRVQQRAREGGVSHLVGWHGLLPDAVRYFQAFDVLVLSSRSEGSPMVLFEAMAAGVPIVATAVGGVPDMVSSREALLVPAEDPAALAEAIRQVAADPEGANARARSAHARLRREFNVERWVAAYDEVYRAVMTQRVGVPIP